VIQKTPKPRGFGGGIVRCAEDASFFHPDYTVGSGFTPDPAFAEISAQARGLARRSHRLASAGLPPIGNWTSLRSSPGPEGYSIEFYYIIPLFRSSPDSYGRVKSFANTAVPEFAGFNFFG
jgi:hypothetical protein